jgi:hypothetical protein
MDVILAQGHTRFSGEGEGPLPDEHGPSQTYPDAQHAPPSSDSEDDRRGSRRIGLGNRHEGRLGRGRLGRGGDRMAQRTDRRGKRQEQAEPYRLIIVPMQAM